MPATACRGDTPDFLGCTRSRPVGSGSAFDGVGDDRAADAAHGQLDRRSRHEPDILDMTTRHARRVVAVLLTSSNLKDDGEKSKSSPGSASLLKTARRLTNAAADRQRYRGFRVEAGATKSGGDFIARGMSAEGDCPTEEISASKRDRDSGVSALGMSPEGPCLAQAWRCTRWSGRERRRL
jgi:hypothetical protein